MDFDIVATYSVIIPAMWYTPLADGSGYALLAAGKHLATLAEDGGYLVLCQEQVFHITAARIADHLRLKTGLITVEEILTKQGIR